MENWRKDYEDGQTVDMIKLTMVLQSRIITNCIFGRGVARRLIDFENDDGSACKLSMLEIMNKLVD